MTFTTDIQLYEILRKKLGTQEAEALVGLVDAKLSLVDAKLKEADDRNLRNLATKEDVKNLEVKIAEAKAETIRWACAFLVPIMLAILGLYLRK